MRRALITGALVAVTGCGIHVNTKLDPTLHYHADIGELSAPPANPPQATPRQVAAQLIVEPLAPYYPLPVGLVYSGSGASRKLRSSLGPQLVAGQRPEQRLTAALRAHLVSGAGPVVVLSGAVIGLELYKLGDRLLARTVLELRVVRGGSEVYTARYTARARTTGRSDLNAVWPDLERQLLGLVQSDAGLWAALEGRS